jgi:hypothetical protein
MKINPVRLIKDLTELQKLRTLRHKPGSPEFEGRSAESAQYCRVTVRQSEFVSEIGDRIKAGHRPDFLTGRDERLVEILERYRLDRAYRNG